MLCGQGSVWRALCAQAAAPGYHLGYSLHMPLFPGILWEALKMIMLIFSLSLAISTNMLSKSLRGYCVSNTGSHNCLISWFAMFNTLSTTGWQQVKDLEFQNLNLS